MTRQTKRASKGQRQQQVSKQSSEPRQVGRLYTERFKQECLSLLDKGKTQLTVSEQQGVSLASLQRWIRAGRKTREEKVRPSASTTTQRQTVPAPESASLSQSSRAPHDNIAGLADDEIEAILSLKRDHYTMGPAQIRAQLKRFKGWRVSVKAIARVLKGNGYPVEHRGAAEERALTRFEAPRPNALWMMDAMTFRVHAQKLYLHLVIDDFSRFIVGHRVSDDITTEEATATLKEAIALHGKPERMLTDRGGQFLAIRKSTAFRRFLEEELIDHSVSRPYHPQTLGKVESVNRAIQKELIYVHEFGSAQEAKAQIAKWVQYFNFKRAHLGIDGLVPADRYFGLYQRVLAQVQERSRGRLATSRQTENIGSPVDDLGGPLEIMRLVLVDSHVELRFCGSRAVLGKITV